MDYKDWEMILIILWLIIGAAGFVFWWTREFDLTLEMAVFGVFASLIGPLAWVLGYFIHSGPKDDIILIRSRKR